MPNHVSGIKIGDSEDTYEERAANNIWGVGFDVRKQQIRLGFVDLLEKFNMNFLTRSRCRQC